MRINLGNTGAVAHAWAHRTQSQGKASSVSFEGRSFLSYSTVIAWVGVDNEGEPVYLLDNHAYSVTTTRHQSEVRSAVPHGAKIHRVSTDGLRWRNGIVGGRLDVASVAMVLVNTIKQAEEYFGGKRRRYLDLAELRTWKRYEGEMLAWVDSLIAFASDFVEPDSPELIAEVNRYHKFNHRGGGAPDLGRETLLLTIGAIITFHTGNPFLVDDADHKRIAADVEREREEQERKQQERIKAEREKQEAFIEEQLELCPDAVERWRNHRELEGTDGKQQTAIYYIISRHERTVGHLMRQSRLTRYTEPTTETNAHATVPTIDIVRVADRVIRLAEKVKEAGQRTELKVMRSFRFGHFRAGSIEADGSIVVGCHRFTLEEMKAYRQHLKETGVWDELASRVESEGQSPAEGEE